jgi:hypothetical protein
MNDQAARDAYLKSIEDEMASAGIETPSGRPDGFGVTVREYATSKNVSAEVARRILDRAVKEGILGMVKLQLGPGSLTSVYARPAEIDRLKGNNHG